MGRSIRAALGLLLLATATTAACAGDGNAGADVRPFRARVVEEARRDRTVSAVTLAHDGRRTATVIAGDGEPPTGVATYPGERFWTDTCRRFTEEGFAQIAGRTARHYKCTRDVRMDVWLDTETDLVLRRQMRNNVVAVEDLEYDPAPATAPRQPLAPGERPPQLTLPLLGGGSVTVPPADGKAEVVLVVTTWCADPCFDAIDDLAARAHELAADRHVLVVATGERAEAVAAALADRPTSLPVAVDAKGRVATTWGVARYPTTVDFDGLGAVG